MSRFVFGLVFTIAVLALAATALGSASPDLTISNVRAVANSETDRTSLTVTVTNAGNLAAGPFDLKIGVFNDTTSASTTFRVAGLLSGGSQTYVAAFVGTQWKCGYGSADVKNEIAESSESNNYRSDNQIWHVFFVGQMLMDTIGLHNPQDTFETVLLTTDAPPGWEVNFSEDIVILAPDEVRRVYVSFIAPPAFEQPTEFSILGTFADGSPGTMDWTVHAFPPSRATDTVVCEPSGGANPQHPSTYWYDVTPGAFGRCDFHVQVFDPNPAHYTNVSKPAPTWQFAVHQVGNLWWASWWDPQCQNAIYTPFRFQFTHSHARTFGQWTTTIDGSSRPFAQVIDSSVGHGQDLDGYGRLVHVPGACTGRETIRKAECELKHGASMVKVVLIRGVAGDAYTILLATGESFSGTLNTRGKGKAKFSGVASGANTATAMWGCGKVETKTFECP